MTVSDISLDESGSNSAKVAATSLLLRVTRGSSDAYIDIGLFWKSEFIQGILFFFAKQDSDCGLFKILMSQFIYFQVYEHIALQKPFVKDQVNIEVFLIEGKSFLARFEQKSFSTW